MRERAALEMGMGPVRPDRGVEGALRWAQTHQGWSILGSQAKSPAPVIAPNPAPNRQFNSVVGAIPSLPALSAIKIQPEINVAAARVPQPTPREKPAPTLAPEQEQPVQFSKPAAAPKKPRPAVIAQAAPQTSIVDTREPVLKLQVVNEQPVLLTSYDAGNQPSFKSSIIREPEPDRQPAFQSPPVWNVFAHSGSSPALPLEPRNLPMALIILLSALSAYMFIRFTSMKCPQCRRLLERNSLACGVCGMDVSAAKL